MKNKLHRNSQKRFYGEDKIYFITTNTEKRFPFFRIELFCRLFIDNLALNKKLKGFLLYGFIIIDDHIHLLIQPGEKFNISEIMFSIKKQFSHNINRVIGINDLPPSYKGEGEQALARLHKHDNEIARLQSNLKIIEYYRPEFVKKYGKNISDFPEFHWQQSFHDHVIRNEKDFFAHLNYIATNCIKHKICEDEEKYKWSFLNGKFDYLFDDF